MVEPFSGAVLASFKLLKGGVCFLAREFRTDLFTNGLLKDFGTGDDEIDQEKVMQAVSALRTQSDWLSKELFFYFLYVAAMHDVWSRDPEKTEKQLRKMKAITPWSGNPKLAKLEMIVWSYFHGGGKKKLAKVRKQDRASAEQIVQAMEGAVQSVLEGARRRVILKTISNCISLI